MKTKSQKGRASRRKGSSSERELANLLQDHLGIEVTRNLMQTRDGGHDLHVALPFAIEVKRQEKLALRTWWRQAMTQADLQDKHPVLAYRQSRQPWRFRLALALLTGLWEDWTEDFDYTVEMELPAFAAICRDMIAAEQEARQIKAGLH